MIIEIDGDKFDVQVIDATHVTTKMIGGSGSPWAFHVMQLSQEMCEKLQALGIMDERKYVKAEGK